MAQPSPSTPSDHPGWAPLIAVCFGTFMLLVDVSIVNVALPQMAVDLHATFDGLQWVVNVYALALAALLLLIGSLSDIVGRKRTYLVGLVVFIIASFACGVAPSQAVIVIARAVQGIGAAAMFATTIALINASYSGRARGAAFGVWGATNGAAAAAGPIVGGLLTQGISWRWVFFVNVPIGIATIVIAQRALKETKPGQQKRIDWVGGLAFTVSAAAATYALVRGNDDGWTSASTLGLFALALVALLAFVVVELRSDEPLFDLRLLRRGPLAGILIAAAVYSATAFAALVYASIWLQTILGLGPIAAGAVMLPLAGLAFVVAPLSGRLLHSAPARWTLGGGLTLMAIGDLVQWGIDGSSSWPRLLIGLALVGIGTGIMSPALASSAMAGVSIERSGMAAGAVNTARQIGLAFGIAVLGSVFSSQIADNLSSQPNSGRLADETASGGAQSVLAHTPAAVRGPLDAVLHNAVGSALATTFVVAGVIGALGALLALVLIRQRGPAPASAAAGAGAEPSAGAGAGASAAARR
jgi:EmrB/QacA subfamily drug resistance transporter